MGDRWSTLEAAARGCVKPADCTCGGSVFGIAHTIDCDDAHVQAWDDFMAMLRISDVLELIRLARLAEGVTP